MCEKSFRLSQTRKQHINSVHIKLKFKCTVCGKVYGRKYRLAAHQLTHSEKERKTDKTTKKKKVKSK